METTHQKHSKICKANVGNFGRNEYSFVGTPCGVIKNLVDEIIDKLHTTYKITYVDADHKNTNSVVETGQCPVSTIYLDKINFQRIDFQQINDFQRKFLLNDQDLILVNGNHFEANQQIVFIDPRKKDSLLKRLPQLTNIKAFILAEGVQEIYDFLKIGDWQRIPTFRCNRYNDIDGITQLIHNQIVSPKINGLVLAGGQSTRMGSDKGLIDYHGKPQREFLYDLMSEICAETYLSSRVGQAIKAFPIIEDKFSELGPLGAILSAFRYNPNAAWLVIACDLPLLDKKTLDLLLEKRNPSKMATAFFNPATNFVEPLITIFEPKAYQVLLNFMALGHSCPRKVLINSDIEIIHLSNANVLMNANTPTDLEQIKKILGQNLIK